MSITVSSQCVLFAVLFSNSSIALSSERFTCVHVGLTLLYFLPSPDTCSLDSELLMAMNVFVPVCPAIDW